MRENTEDFHLDSLLEAFLSLKNKEECSAFFDDLFSPAEIRSFCQRFEVATLLNSGEKFTDIEKKTGASSATISRISRCLTHGKGYATVLKRITKEP